MELQEKVKRAIGLGLYDKMTTPVLPGNIDQYVVAGNARRQMGEFPPSFALPQDAEVGGEFVPTDIYEMMIVLGNSMCPEGIKNGDEILLTDVVASQIAYGDFIVIKVDPEFYQFRHNGRTAHFKKKLRKALMPITGDMTVEQITTIMAEQHNEYLSESEMKDLSESLDEARSYYKSTPLYLSVTYHDGNIHYSLHPQSNIIHKVEVVARKKNEAVVFMRPADLFN